MRAIAWALIFWVISLIAAVLYFLVDTPRAGLVMLVALLGTCVMIVISAKGSDPIEEDDGE